MNQNTRPHRHRAGPLFGALLLVVTGALAFTPVVPRVGAIDPTPDPAPAPAHLTLTKSVDNTRGGTAAATDWTLSATGPTTISGPTGDSGITNAAVDAGTYTLAESGGPTGYSAEAWICTGGTLTGSSLVLTAGETASCSITNTFVPPDPTPTPAPDPTPTPTPDPTPTPTPEAVRGYLSMSADAPTEGRRRVDPGSVVTVHLAARVLDDAKDVRMVAVIPDGWSVAGAAGGTVDRNGGTVTWGEGDLEAGARVTEIVRLRAPGRSPQGRPAFDTVLEAQLEHADIVIDSATVRLRVAPEIIVEHVTFARVDDPRQTPSYLELDAALDEIGQYDTFRIRFQVRNADLVASRLTPGLQYRLAGAWGFADVPPEDVDPDGPFYLYTEWRPVAGGRGTLPGPTTETIAATDLREHDRDDDTQEPAPGKRLMGADDVPVVSLEGDSYTEVEFTVRATIDLPFEQVFDFRLVDGGRPISGAAVAVVRSGPQPPANLSPGQRNGIYVGPPVDAKPAAVSEVDFPLVTPNFVAAVWPESNATPRYRLAIAVPKGPLAQYPLNGTFTSAHTPDVSLVSDTCAICHRAHVAQGTNLLAKAAPQATMCFTCHNSTGTGSDLKTQTQYTDAAVPANDAASRSYYRHDAVTAPVAPFGHSLAQNNEFGGVSNRHSECADCHNSHNATAAVSTQTTTGWTVAGQNVAVSGVSVANGAAGTAPTYTFLDGSVGSPPTREYQICFKCHSGFTVLPSNTGQPPSRMALDKGIELNPNNASFHPVEAAGTNPNTTIMNSNLSGTSPHKQWNFTTTSTIRCVNCHGDPRKYNATLPIAGGLATAAGDDLAPHTSQYRGILIQNYRDGRYVAGSTLPGNQGLKPNGEAYVAADFALCLVCHAEEPFTNTNSTLTNFRRHFLHVSNMPTEGSGGLDIDVAGAGTGNAICSECHFRVHSTALRTGTQNAYARLVNFAPNVGGSISFTPKGAGNGSCTLICHGKDHNGKDY